MSRITIFACSVTLVIAGICEVEAQPVQTPLPGNNRAVTPGPIPQTPWFNNEAVRQNLNLTQDQYNRLAQAYGTAWNERRL